MPDRVKDKGREVSEKRTTTVRDGMSEKERNRASQLKNKCELIRPQEAFYVTLALPSSNVLQRLFCVCMCVNVCFHGSEKVILTARDHSLFVCACSFMHTNICKSSLKALRCVYAFEMWVLASTHVHT